jgi:hypothetical protein
MRVPSDPRFLRLVGRAAAAGAAALCLLALAVPAPLLPAADPGAPPNPARSAWFLLWVQELVAHGKGWAWPILAAAAAFLFLPWLAPHRRSPAEGEEAASALPSRGSRGAARLLLLLAALLVVLTVVAAFFRGENWSWRLPF